jgi:branched-chain amino acid transport system substrate-binding protein
MQKVKLFLVFVLIVSLTVGMALGCGQQGTDVPPDGDFAGTIKIGGIFSTSGAMAGMGTLYKESLQIAIDEVNNNGGVTVDGEKYLLRGYFRDDESSPDVSSRRLRELNNEGIELFIGGTAAHLLSAMGEAAGATESLVIGTTMPADSYYKKGKYPYAFCWLGSTNQVGIVGAEWVASQFKPKKIAYFMPDYAYGHDSFAGATGYLDANYPDIEYDVVWSPVGAPDMSPYIINVRDMNPDVIVMGHWGGDAILALKQAYELGLHDVAPIYFQGMISVFATAIEPAALEGVQFGSFWHHDMSGLGDAEIEALSAQMTVTWNEITGKNPDAYGVGPYIALQELVRGIELANSTKATEVGQALYDNPDFMTPKGKATWREDGRPVHEYFFFIFEGIPVAERTDQKWDFGRVIGSVKGDVGMTSLKDLGY